MAFKARPTILDLRKIIFQLSGNRHSSTACLHLERVCKNLLKDRSDVQRFPTPCQMGE